MAAPESSPEPVANVQQTGFSKRPRTDTKPLVVIRELQKTFLHMGRPLEVLKGIDLEIHEGEIVAIVGKSGAGKSTLLQCIGTLDMPTAGIIRLGEDYLVGLSRSDLARTRNHMIGFVFQFHHLLPEFTALENVMMPGLIQGLRRSLVETRARELLSDVGLESRATHRPGELSGGEQQRVALARALLLKPKLILADEPTGNLDTATSDAIHNLFFDINKKHGTTIVVVTHNLKLAESMPRVIRMRDGRVDNDTDPPGTRFEVDETVLERSRVLAKVRYAGFWTRAGARAVDFGVWGLLGVATLVGVVSLRLGLLAASPDEATSIPAGLSHPLVGLAIVLLVGQAVVLSQAITEWVGRGATLGKLIFGVRVRMENLDKPRLGAMVMRNQLVIVDSLFCGLVAYLGIRSSLLRQRFGDGLAQTVVLDSRSIPKKMAGRPLRGIATGLAVVIALHALLALAVLAYV